MMMMGDEMMMSRSRMGRTEPSRCGQIRILRKVKTKAKMSVKDKVSEATSSDALTPLDMTIPCVLVPLALHSPAERMMPATR